MKRREFLGNLPALGWFFVEAQQALGKTLAGCFLHDNNYLMVYPVNHNLGVPVPIWWEYGLAYVSAQKLADAFRFHTFLNQEKRKLVIYLPQNQVVVGADLPYVIIDGKAFQMPVEALWNEGEIYVPLRYLVPLINRFTNLSLTYDEALLELRANSKGFNVAGLTIETKKNGMVIRIRTSRKFKRGEISTDIRNDWLHVDLYRASGDKELLEKTPGRGMIRKVQVFQFPELLSLAFQLKKFPLSREVYQDGDTDEVVVILRYSEELPEEELADDEGDMPVDEEIEKQLAEERKRWFIDTVVIDPGHGGKDPGAIGVGGLREKDVVLAIALKLGHLIRRKLRGVRVVFTRTTDTFVELRRRTQIANENGAKVFISIHANANRSRHASGFESYILGPEKGEAASSVVERENSVIKFEDPGSQRHYQGINTILAKMMQAAFMKQSEQLAANVQEEMAERLRRLHMKNRGVKQAPFWVMVGATMPSVLVETGFITNPQDARILGNSRHQQRIAEGIFAGLQQFKREYESTI
ncbi:MAG: hypothetical protein D6681_04465 [Calditrichaeota bacterium]|nr:MAG: hypothetical protein D6681_04465 [Calditrichota bacterium]